MTTSSVCLDCKKGTAGRGNRCKSCAAKHRWANPEIRKKMCAGIKRGHNTPEYKAAIIMRWKNPAFKKRVSAKIKLAHNTSEFKEKMHAIRLAAWRNSRQRRNMLNSFADRYRREASIPELVVKAFLEANFAEVIHQYVPDEEMSPGVLDFFVPSTDMIIEVDGDYWHGKEGKQKRDLEKEEFALEYEYGFIRIKESDAKNPEYLLSLLKELSRE